MIERYFISCLSIGHDMIFEQTSTIQYGMLSTCIIVLYIYLHYTHYTNMPVMQDIIQKLCYDFNNVQKDCKAVISGLYSE